MRVVIVGAGSVGRSIAQELLQNEHAVLLIDKDANESRVNKLPDASWLSGDACELSTLQEAEVQTCDVVVCATGDDKANLVVSLLAKTEFGVPRTVARVNNPKNEWMFDESWGVDVAVSTPRMLASLVEEAVSVGDLVRLMSFRKGQANLVELTLPSNTPLAGKPVRKLELPRDAALVAILRGGRVIVPQRDDPLEGGDELVFIAPAEAEPALYEAMQIAR